MSGNVVTADFAALTPLVVGLGDMYIPPSRNIGFSGTNASGNPIHPTAWKQTGPRLFEVTFSAPPSSIRYNAFAHDPAIIGDDFEHSADIGLIRDMWGEPSVFLPGEVNHRWALGSEITFGGV